MDDTTSVSIHEAINNFLAHDSVLVTDEFRSYNNLPFEHLSVNYSAKQYVDGLADTTGIESVWALIKRGFYGIYHHFTAKHMQRYINEFTFWLNQGNGKIHVMDRIRTLLARILATPTLTTKQSRDDQIIKGKIR